MTFKKSLLTATLLTVAGLTAVSSANAADQTSEPGYFDVTLTVDPICSVTAAEDINFGSHVAGATISETSTPSNILVNCSKTTAYNISLAGTGLMTDSVSSNTVAYSLLREASGTEWGVVTTENTDANVGGLGQGMTLAQAQPHTVFASLAANSTNNLTPGIYKDTVTVTVTY